MLGNNASWTFSCFRVVRTFRAKEHWYLDLRRIAWQTYLWSSKGVWSILPSRSICFHSNNNESWVICLHFRLVKERSETSSHPPPSFCREDLFISWTKDSLTLSPAEKWPGVTATLHMLQDPFPLVQPLHSCMHSGILHSLHCPVENCGMGNQCC